MFLKSGIILISPLHRLCRVVFRPYVTTMQNQNELIEESEARRLLGGISARALRSLRESRRIRYFKFGRRTIRYSRTDIFAFIESTAIEPVARIGTVK